MHIADIISWQYKRDNFTTVSIREGLLRWMYFGIVDNTSMVEWRIIKIPKRFRKRLNQEIDQFGETYGIDVPVEFRSYVLSYWKEEIVFIEDEYMQYNFYKTLPKLELREFYKEMDEFRTYGVDRRFIPIGYDGCGDTVLLNSEDGTVWLLDTDSEGYRKLDESMSVFFNRIKYSEDMEVYKK